MDRAENAVRETGQGEDPHLHDVVIAESARLGPAADGPAPG
ncbi:hypothetical protein ACIQWB_22965 [Streptomyces olivaceus]